MNVPQVLRNDKEHWAQIVNEARSNRQLCDVLASFLADNCVVLTSTLDRDTGVFTYGVEFDRPHVAEVERGPGRKHWTVKEK